VIALVSALMARPWLMKLIGAGLLIGGVMFAIHRYGDAKILEGQYKERIAKYGQLEIELLANQKVVADKLTSLEEINRKDIQISVEAETQIRADIDSLERQLMTKLAELAKLREQRDTQIDNMPPAELPDQIRSQSRRLAEQPQPPDD
jgi:hypothetical protein